MCPATAELDQPPTVALRLSRPAVGPALCSHLSMPVGCSQCGAATVWDDAVGSDVCTVCGSLADPSQSVLTSSQFGNQNDTAEPSLWDSSASTPSKVSAHATTGILQGKARNRGTEEMRYVDLAILLTAFSYEMAEFIKSLAASFNATGLSPRAITLFTQAKSASNFRWGQKSRSVAAACLAIAFRESNRPDSIRDIASILRVPLTSVSREFTSITSMLKLSLNLVDPSVHISTLHNHVASTVKGHQQVPGLSSSLVNSLQPLCLRSTARTATSLSQVLARLSPNHDVLRLPVPPTACGLFILALEAENRTALNPLGELAQFLGSRCHAAKSVVMSRYKTIQDEIASWIEKVPWLDKYESKKGRAKISKRVIVARGLKDVINFQEDIWQQQTKSLLETELDDADDPLEVKEFIHSNAPPPRKRPKLNHALTQTTHFLLDPLGSSVSSTLSAAAKLSQPTSSLESTSHMPLATYILTNPPNSLIRQPPTRLQLLAQDRGGVGEDQIPDDELFAEGEFEKLLRSEDEIQIFKHTFDWSAVEDREANEQSSTAQRPRQARTKRTRTGEAIPEELPPRKKSRINMEALAQFLADDGKDSQLNSQEDVDTSMLGLEEAVDDYDIGADDKDDDNNDEDDITLFTFETPPRNQNQHRTDAHTNDTDNTGDDEVILEDWRPQSPSGAQGVQYDEEYD
ncbi:hypothetical protein BJ912DRAFT_1059516 [Pholiota molesta]|nr:hypothetical protein BJ912DRAFT_1059516 [Pholiota molesta]